MAADSPPKLARKILMSFLRADLTEEVLGDLDEKFSSLTKTRSPLRAKLNYWYQVLNYLRPFALRKSVPLGLIQFDMFRSYFKIGIRNLLHHKSHAFINIAGLAAGITCCLFIVLYISDELSYDRYHQKADRIYRLVIDNRAKVPPAAAPEIKDSYPHLVEDAARVWPLYSPAKMRHEDRVFVESGGVFADPGMLSVFSIPMIAGNPSKALSAPNSIVLTTSTAAKYFGDKNPLGAHLKFWGRDLTVTGVVTDIPLNAHLRFDFIISFTTLFDVMGSGLDQNWGLPVFYTYLLTPEGVSGHDLEIAAQQLFGSRNVGTPLQPWLQPLTRIHLHSRLEGEFAPGGNTAYLYTLGTAALIVLLLACINFTNLTTARAATRTKEVGMRKVLGAMRRQLIGQFFGEALMMCMTAFVLAIFLLNLGLPAFNQLSGKAIHVRDITAPAFGLGLLAIMLLIGLVAGAYPALYLSRFRPIQVLKGSGHVRVSNLLLRKGLIVFQFTISTVFLIGMAIVFFQLNYLQQKDLGFDKAQVLVLDGDNFPLIRDALQGVTGVEHVAGVPQVLGMPLPASPYKAEGILTDSMSQMKHYGVTTKFIETMGIHFIAGRGFIEGSESDNESAFILNESALRELGWSHPEEAIGKPFSISVPPMNGGSDEWREGKVVGVVKDFNYDALYNPIAPVVLYPSYDLNLTIVRVRQVNREVMAGIEGVWKKINPDAPFNYYFLDDYLSQQYEAEAKLSNIMGTATALAILIATLGLFGLIAFSAVQRTKEIGIRKVLGATVSQIVVVLSSDFLRLVCLAVVLAIPLAYFVMSRWLDNFAYHITLPWFLFVGGGAFVILIAFFTLGYQSVKAAKADPAQSMRYE